MSIKGLNRTIETYRKTDNWGHIDNWVSYLSIIIDYHIKVVILGKYNFQCVLLSFTDARRVLIVADGFVEW